MKNIMYNKKCNAGKLHAELLAAGWKEGIDFSGVTTRGISTVVHVLNPEKSPDLIVDNHVFSAPETPEQIHAALAADIDALDLKKPGNLKSMLKRIAGVSDA